MQDQYQIRPAVVQNAADIAHVHVESWRTTYAGIVPQAYLSNMDVQRRQQFWHSALTNSETKGAIFVAQQPQHGVVGFASVGPSRENGHDYQSELYAIYLLESQQRQGLGKRLFESATQWLMAQGLNSMMLWVLERNPAQGFYQSLGGKVFKSQTITIGEKDLTELAYGWQDLGDLTH